MLVLQIPGQPFGTQIGLSLTHVVGQLLVLWREAFCPSLRARAFGHARQAPSGAHALDRARTRGLRPHMPMNLI